MIRRLEKAGYLDRVPSPRDQRAMLVRLTPSGRTLTRELVPISLQLSARLLDPIPEAERGRFVELLTMIGRDPADAPQDETGI